MEVCPEPERIILQNSAAFGNDSLDIGQRGETQMIRHMRHGSPPRLMAPQPICVPERRESHPTPSAGNRMIRCPVAVASVISGGAVARTGSVLQPRPVNEMQ